MYVSSADTDFPCADVVPSSGYSQTVHRIPAAMDVNMNYGYFVQPQHDNYPSPTSNYAASSSPRLIYANPSPQYPPTVQSEWQIHFDNGSNDSRRGSVSSSGNKHRPQQQHTPPTTHYQRPPPPVRQHLESPQPLQPQRPKKTSEWHLQIRRIKATMEASEQELKQLNIEISSARGPDDLFQLLKRHAMQEQHLEICRRAVSAAYKEARTHGVYVDL